MLHSMWHGWQSLRWQSLLTCRGEQSILTELGQVPNLDDVTELLAVFQDIGDCRHDGRLIKEGMCCDGGDELIMSLLSCMQAVYHCQLLMELC